MTNQINGEYIFAHYGYNRDDYSPQLALISNDNEQLFYIKPRGLNITIEFDKSKRYCTGWHDLETSQSHPCPDKATVSDEYDQCRHCQIKTGFNPAFYHSQTISKQQAARNLLPHILYIVNFGTRMNKVGISWADRGIQRLLDQGARSGIIIKTFPTANVARQYEAKIAKMDGLVENVKFNIKYKLLKQPYDSTAADKELDSTLNKILDQIKITIDETKVIHLDKYYLENKKLSSTIIDLQDENTVSGHCIGMIGGTLVFEQDSTQYLFPMNKLKGYKVRISDQIQTNEHQPQQASLF